MPELKLTRIHYFSRGDEQTFFDWLERIPPVEKVYGVGLDLFVRISSTSIPDDDLRELIGIFVRYNLDAPQLRLFLNSKNEHWFGDSEGAFWHEAIFGNR